MDEDDFAGLYSAATADSTLATVIGRLRGSPLACSAVAMPVS